MYSYFTRQGFSEEDSELLKRFCKDMGMEYEDMPSFTSVMSTLQLGTLREKVDRANQKSGRGRKEWDMWHSEEP